MLDLIGRRLVALVAVLFGLAVIVFALQAVIPSDPARAMVGASASPEAVAAKAHELGYDKPLPQRFADYLGRTVERGPAVLAAHAQPGRRGPARRSRRRRSSSRSRRRCWRR